MTRNFRSRYACSLQLEFEWSYSVCRSECKQHQQLKAMQDDVGVIVDDGDEDNDAREMMARLTKMLRRHFRATCLLCTGSCGCCGYSLVRTLFLSPSLFLPPSLADNQWARCVMPTPPPRLYIRHFRPPVDNQHQASNIEGGHFLRSIVWCFTSIEPIRITQDAHVMDMESAW